MSKVVAGVSKLTVNQLIAKSLLVETKMTGNPSFATPVPAIADLTTARGLLEAANVLAMGGGVAAVLDKNMKAAVLMELLTQEAGYVTSVANGDVPVIISSGFDARKVPERIGLLSMPENLRARLTEFSGQVLVKWNYVYGAHSYIVSRKPDDGEESPWAAIAVVTRATYTDEGLATGRFYWYQVVAIGAAGPSPASDPARTLIG